MAFTRGRRGFEAMYSAYIGEAILADAVAAMKTISRIIPSALPNKGAFETSNNRSPPNRGTAVPEVAGDGRASDGFPPNIRLRRMHCRTCIAYYIYGVRLRFCFCEPFNT